MDQRQSTIVRTVIIGILRIVLGGLAFAIPLAALAFLVKYETVASSIMFEHPPEKVVKFASSFSIWVFGFSFPFGIFVSGVIEVVIATKQVGQYPMWILLVVTVTCCFLLAMIKYASW